jgi:hypothetical protein
VLTLGRRIGEEGYQREGRRAPRGFRLIYRDEEQSRRGLAEQRTILGTVDCAKLLRPSDHRPLRAPLRLGLGPELDGFTLTSYTVDYSWINTRFWTYNRGFHRAIRCMDTDRIGTIISDVQVEERPRNNPWAVSGRKAYSLFRKTLEYCNLGANSNASVNN